MLPRGWLVERIVSLAASRRLLVGAVNRGGRAAAWARAADDHLDGLDAVSLQISASTGPGADIGPDPAASDAKDASAQLRHYVETAFTHVLIEAGRGIVGPSAVADAVRLRAAGVHAGIVIDRRTVTSRSRSSKKARAREKLRVSELREQLQAYPGPLFVTSAGLVDDFPDATWLPTVVDPDQLSSPDAPLRRDRPVVAYGYGVEVDGDPVDAILSELADEGTIAYARIADLALEGAIAAADVVIDAGDTGDYSLAAIHALAAGRFVLGTVSDTVRERVRQRTGTELPILPLDPGSLRRTLLDLCAEPGAHRRRAAEGPATVRALHSAAAAAAALADLVDRPPRVLPATVVRREPKEALSRPAPPSGRSRPHVLYVAWGFPPCRGSGVYRALATANALHRHGFDVTVLTIRREVFERYTGIDPSLEELIEPGIVVERLDFDWPVLESEISLWPRERAQNPAKWLAQRREVEQAEFPELTYGPWKPALLAAADRIADSRAVDLVIGTANPNVDLAVGPHLAATRGVPYVMDYRDAWRLDVFSGDELPLDERVKGLEASYVADAAEMWFVNDPIRNWHGQEYPSSAARMFTVMNGYDEELAPLPRLSGPAPGTGLRFGYIGIISLKVPIAEFIAGWRLAREQDEVLRRSSADLWGYLGFYATDNPVLKQQLSEGADQDVFFRGRIDKARAVAAYESFDVLLLILGAGQYVTSGKVFEYMASGLPIVSVHDPGNAASAILADYPLWFPAADLSEVAVADALSRAGQAAATAGEAVRRDCLEIAAAYERETQLGPRVGRLYASCLEGR